MHLEQNEYPSNHILIEMNWREIWSFCTKIKERLAEKIQKF
jgi:hypothetical protein